MALDQAPQLRILAPLPEDLVAGEMTIVAEMEPAAAPVSQMVFSVDGHLFSLDLELHRPLGRV